MDGKHTRRCHRGVYCHYWAIPENTLGVLQYAEHVLTNGHARCTDGKARCTHMYKSYEDVIYVSTTLVVHGPCTHGSHLAGAEYFREADCSTVLYGNSNSTSSTEVPGIQQAQQNARRNCLESRESRRAVRHSRNSGTDCTCTCTMTVHGTCTCTP